jgi:capsular exopolysaccharide synthesis family protein
MNTLEKYLDNVIEQKPVYLPPPHTPHSEPTANLISGVLRRWYIAAAIFLLVCAIGLPVIWLSIQPIYSVTGAIRVAPILTNILSGEADRGEISNYQNFVNTQAQMVTSPQVVEIVADYLVVEKKLKLSFFEPKTTGLVPKLNHLLKTTETNPEPANILKQAILNQVITATADRSSELIKVTMKSPNPTEAEQIVNAFISKYKDYQGFISAQVDDNKLKVLKTEQLNLATDLEIQRTKIADQAQEYGTTTLAGRYDMKLQRVASLLAELTKMEARRLYLEAQVKVLELTKEESISTQELLKLREEYVNSDPAVKLLVATIIQLEQELIVANQTLTSNNSELVRRKELLEVMKSRLEEQKQTVGKTFDETMSTELTKNTNQKLLNAQVELEQTKAYENQFREILSKEDTETIGLGRKQLAIQDLQDQLDLTKQIYDTISRRIQETEMEQKRPGRISDYLDAEISQIQDKRIKFSMVLMFGAAACGTLLALLREKIDRSLHTPDDIVRRIGIPLIGTTTSSQTIKPALLPGQIVEDYQTIRANLGLLNGGGMPKKVVVTSPGIQEGKTTFAINLATSMAKSGKKVLLIDGDLRKPDIAYLLNLPHGSRGLQDLLSGKEFEQVVCTVPSTGLDVLAADSHNSADACEMLASPIAAQQINIISQRYDHLIIDTPPVLAFPDALLWAKLADGVILASFAGRTTTEDLRETTLRLKQINVRVLGTILSNVNASDSYYHYSYNHYYSQNVNTQKNTKRVSTKILMPLQNPQDNPENPSNPEQK